MGTQACGPRRYFVEKFGLIVVLLAAAASCRAEVSIAPGADIQAAVDNNPGGTTFHVAAGLYRMQEITPKDGDIFTGDPGAILCGARLLSTFSREGTYWVAAGQSPAGDTYGPTESGWEGSAYSQDFFLDNVALQHVLSLAAVAPGKWYYDYANSKVYFADDPTGRKAELGVSRRAFAGPAANVTIQGFVIEKYCTPAQGGAVGDQWNIPSNWLVQNNEIRLNHGMGLKSATGWQVLHNNIHHNGQMGTGGDGDNMLFDGNEIAFNNTLHFDAGWEAGGAKWALSNGAIIRNNYSHDNLGTGLWTDIDNINSLYEGNTVIHNAGPGIQHEISYKATIRNNICKDNGWGGSPWLWNSQIQIQNSQNVEVYGNTVEVGTPYGNGIGIIYQDRGTGKYGPYFPQNNYIHNNSITYTSSTVGLTGAVADFDQTNFWTNGHNLFDYDNYYTPSSSSFQWAWQDSERTFAEFQSFGQEVHGTLNGPQPVAPTITTQPANESVSAGQTATFTVAASGTAPLSYQWQKNGANIAGARSASYTTPATTHADTGSAYRVLVSNSVGSVTSNSATLTVINRPPVVTSAAAALPNAANVGQNITFTVSATDSDGDTLAYAWNFGDGSSGTGASTTHAYASAGTYTAIATITDGHGAGVSSSVTVTIGALSAMAINSGGNAAGSFGSDRYFSGGRTYSTSSTIDTTGATRPAPQAVYRTERYGNFTYTVPGLTVGAAYLVRLHFAEIYWSAAGRRVFNVAINGQQVLANFDIYAAAGGKFKAIVREFPATANASGAIAITYATIKDNAKSSGIEVIAGSAAPAFSAIESAASDSAAAADLPVDLGTVKQYQRFKLTLDRPTDQKSAKFRWSIATGSALPKGITLQNGVLTGKATTLGTIVFKVQIETKTERVTNEYTLTVVP